MKYKQQPYLEFLLRYVSISYKDNYNIILTSFQTSLVNNQRKNRGGLYGILANMLDCNIIVNSNSNHTIISIFGLIPLEKIQAPLFYPTMG